MFGALTAGSACEGIRKAQLALGKSGKKASAAAAKCRRNWSGAKMGAGKRAWKAGKAESKKKRLRGCPRVDFILNDRYGNQIRTWKGQSCAKQTHDGVIIFGGKSKGQYPRRRRRSK